MACCTHVNDEMADAAGKAGRHFLVRCLAGLAVLLAGTTACRAADFPSRPVQLIVPFAAGSTADVVARALGQALREHWSEPVVVLNRPGAG